MGDFLPASPPSTSPLLSPGALLVLGFHSMPPRPPPPKKNMSWLGEPSCPQSRALGPGLGGVVCVCRTSWLFAEAVFGVSLTRTLVKFGGVEPWQAASWPRCCWLLGALGGVRGRKGPGSWTSREGSAARRGPWPEWKAADFVFKETRLHCASRAQPAESGGEQPTARLSWRTKPPFCFCCLRGAATRWVPAGPQDRSQGSAERLPLWSPAPGQGGGSGPPGKPSTRAPCRRREVRGSWEPAFPWRPGAWASCASTPELPSVPALPGPQSSHL